MQPIRTEVRKSLIEEAQKFLPQAKDLEQRFDEMEALLSRQFNTASGLPADEADRLNDLNNLFRPFAI